jgi:hypothetical protein
MASRHKQTKKVSKSTLVKAIRDTTKRIRKLDLELRRILHTMESAPICQQVHVPPVTGMRKTKRLR